jgi:hypothetical protein
MVNVTASCSDGQCAASKRSRAATPREEDDLTGTPSPRPPRVQTSAERAELQRSATRARHRELLVAKMNRDRLWFDDPSNGGSGAPSVVQRHAAPRSEPPVALS